MVAIFTNSNDKVIRRHYKPDEIDTSDAAYEGEQSNIPEPTDRPNVLYYNDTDGFWYEYPKSDQETRIEELENTIADVIGG